MKIILIILGWMCVSAIDTNGEYAQLGAITDGRASIPEILIDPVIRLFPRDVANQYKVYVESFEVVCSYDLTSSAKSGFRNANLSPEQVKLIQKCRRGDKIYIEQILVNCPDCCSTKMSPITITVER